MKEYYKVIVVGQIEGDTASFWFHNSVNEIEAVASARKCWLSNWHGEPIEIIVER